MWLYMLGGAILLLGIVGGVLTGGIFTIVFIPLGIIMLLAAAGFAMWSRAAAGAGGASTNAHPSTNQPLPHAPQGESAHVPTSPEALADARRVQQ